ncbi:MAG: PKD domain-containing protein [Bacteroidia bacterium]
MKKIIQVLSVAVLVALTFNAKGQTGPYTYTAVGTGDFNATTSWVNSGGANPSTWPTPSAETLNIYATASTMGSSSWTVTSGSTINIGDGTTAASFNTGLSTNYIVNTSGPSSRDLNLIVNNNATLKINSGDIFTYYISNTNRTFNTGSTVVYDDVNAVVGKGDYYNLTILKDATLNTHQISVANVCKIGATLSMIDGGITFKGTISGTGSIIGSSGARIEIASSTSTSVGTLPLTGQVKTFIISAGSVTLGYDVLVSSVGDADSSVFYQSGGSLKLNGKKLTLDVDNDATFGSATNVITGGSTSALVIKSLTFGGGGANATLFMDQTNSNTNSLRCLVLNDSINTFNIFTLGNPLNITDSISPTAGDLETGGFLTLIADQTTVGKVGRVGIVGGDINGDVTAQVFHNPTGNQTNWMLMGSAGIDSPTFADWNNNFVITCPSGCNYTGVQGTAFNSVQSYDETTGSTFGDAAHYNPIGGLTDVINPGQGYWVYLGTANPGINIPGELISITGGIKSGDVTIGLKNANTGDLINYGYNLVANPYPSPISWKKVVAASGIGSSSTANNYYAYSASIGTGGGDYMIYNASSGISNPASGTYTVGDIIPAGLGFYVQTDQASSISLHFKESAKCGDPNHHVLFREANQENNTANVTSTSTSLTHYFSLQVTGNNNESWAAISFNANATDTIDGFDATAIGYNGALQISSSYAGNRGRDYSINGLPELNQNYTIPVKILSGTTSQYQINPVGMENMLLGACLNLHDNYLNADYDLRGGSFNLTINDTETVARFTLQVTMAQLPTTVNAKQASCANKADGLITAVGNNAGPWNYIWRNSNGTIVKSSLNKTTADTLTGLNNGVFTVEVNTVGACDGSVQTFTFTSPVLASVFTAPTQVIIGSAITFTNTSANATSYNWQFGDGNTASQQSPSYTYNNTGTYTVTLYAINTACNDTATSTQVVEVDANTTGIKSLSANNNNIYVSKDATGNYLQFNYAAQTKVNITVYNVLGQVMLSNAGLSVVTDKIYLNVADSKNQVLYVTITDLTTNIQTTKKFLNN